MVAQTGVTRARVTDYQWAVMHSPFEHTAFFGGVAVGKTFTGSQWAIKQMFERPDLTGIIGANTYDQLSGATLRELFYWLDQGGIPYVSDQRPPREWGQTRKVFKTYQNVLSLRVIPGIITTVFTRVMGFANPLRGIEASWYWLDETRDTPSNTFDVILSRLRESDDYRRGLITSTTNGEDWAFDRFVTKAEWPRRGALHVPTSEAIRCGLHAPDYLEMLRSSYDPLTAAQELDAEHVDVLGGRAYHAFGKWNTKPCPWGDTAPNPHRPLIVGEDFNYDPAPMLWVVGQLGPDGTKWEDHIHWFGEVVGRQRSTRQQTQALIEQYGTQFFYQCFGDASGGRGSTSNAGEHDYAQQAEEMQMAGVGYSIDFDPANPRVIDRVTNMNRLAKNSLGETHMTYDKQACPHFHEDVRKVGWRKTIIGRGKLDDKGNPQLTHASDGVGYAVWKLLPMARRGDYIEPIHTGSALGEIRSIG